MQWDLLAAGYKRISFQLSLLIFDFSNQFIRNNCKQMKICVCNTIYAIQWKILIIFLIILQKVTNMHCIPTAFTVFFIQLGTSEIKNLCLRLYLFIGIPNKAFDKNQFIQTL